MILCYTNKRLDTSVWDKKFQSWSHSACSVWLLRPPYQMGTGSPHLLLLSGATVARAWDQIILPQPGVKCSSLCSTKGISTNYPFVISKALTWPRVRNLLTLYTQSQDPKTHTHPNYSISFLKAFLSLTRGLAPSLPTELVRWKSVVQTRVC